MTGFMISFVCALLLSFTTWLCAMRRSSLVGPEVVIGLLWVLFFLLTAIVGFGFYVSVMPCAIITLGVMAFQLGGSFVRSAPPGFPGRTAELWYPRLFMVIGAMCGLASLYIHLTAGGVAISDYGTNFTDTAASVAAKQYAQDDDRMDGTALSKALVALLLASSYLAGLYRNLSPGAAHNRWMLLNFGTALLRTVLTTTRSSFFMAFCNYLCGYAAGMVLTRGDGSLRLASSLKTAVLALPILLAVIILPGLVRYRADAASLWTSLDHMRPWIGGNIPTFCVWFDDFYTNRPEAYRDALILPLKVQFLAADVADFSELTEPYEISNQRHQSNAATIFKPLIGQWGVAGALIAMLCAGFFSSLMYRGCQAGNLLAAGLLTLVYSVIIFTTSGWYFMIGRRTFPSLCMIVYCMLCRSARHEPDYPSIRADRYPVNAESKPAAQ